jgi:hypothetical protein
MPAPTGEVLWGELWWALNWVSQHFEQVENMSSVDEETKEKVRALRHLVAALQSDPAGAGPFEPAVTLPLPPSVRADLGSRFIGCAA